MVEPKKVLLIDDDVDLQHLTKITLKSRGYAVETANNGLEGLEKLETIKPDLIILDMNMPKLGGLGFYLKLCDGQPKAPYPILILTARANMESLLTQMNVQGYIPKPYDIDEFLKKVDSIIRS